MVFRLIETASEATLRPHQSVLIHRRGVAGDTRDIGHLADVLVLGRRLLSDRTCQQKAGVSGGHGMGRTR